MVGVHVGVLKFLRFTKTTLADLHMLLTLGYICHGQTDILGGQIHMGWSVV